MSKMQQEIVRMFWKCPSCDTPDIDGLIDVCPNCGAKKPESTEYYIKEDASTAVTEEELQEAGMTLEECDGNHKDWVCSYCNTLNNYSYKFCESCGSPKEEAQYEYKMNSINSNGGTASANETVNQQNTTMNTAASRPTQRTKRKKSSWKLFGVLGFFAAVIALLVFLFYPTYQTEVVESFRWKRTVVVEEYSETIKTGDSLPSGATLISKKEVEAGKKKVVSHYETKTTYKDNGNGTATKVTEEVPVYKYETQYKTQYKYSIYTWKEKRSYKSDGEDHNPYWNTDYILKSNQRDTNKTGKYEVKTDSGKYRSLPLSTWEAAEVGDTLKIKTCRVGKIYDIAIVANN